MISIWPSWREPSAVSCTSAYVACSYSSNWICGAWARSGLHVTHAQISMCKRGQQRRRLKGPSTRLRRWDVVSVEEDHRTRRVQHLSSNSRGMQSSADLVLVHRRIRTDALQCLYSRVGCSLDACVIVELHEKAIKHMPH